MPDKRDKRIIDTLKAGIAKVETGAEKNPYLSKNRSGSSAVGKYQFLKEWFSRSGSVKGIKQFADSKNGAFGEVNSMEDFRQSPELQEAYFSYYAENVLLPEAKKALVKNPMDLSLDQAAMFFHFKSPPVARKSIQTGKMNGSTSTNVSEDKYLSVYNKGLEEAGLSNISYNDYLIDKKNSGELAPEEKKAFKTIEERKNSYIKRDKAISEMDDVDNGVRENLRKNLLKEIAKNGDQKIWDEVIQEQNMQISNNNNLLYQDERKKVSDNTRTKSTNRKNDLKGSKPNLDEDLAAWENREGPVDTVKNPYGKDSKKTNVKKGSASYDINNKIQKERPRVQWDPINQEVQAEIKAAQKPTPEMGEVKEKPVPKQLGDVQEEQEILGDQENAGLASQFFSTAQEINQAKQSNNPAVPEQKQALPVEAVTGLALGLIGNDKARDADIPLRTEEVNEAINQYTSDLSRRAKEGLPVEIEAAMNNKQAEAYQSGLENIKNASAGNRALILGNQGQLETARNRGLVDIQVADYEAKEKAFQQYGQMLKYKNDFDARRDIANHGIQYQEGKDNQQRGRDLATAGFAKLSDEIQYQRENGPGSTNAMYKSYLMQKMFGFDPNAKDDGSGQPGTRSAFLAEKGKTETEAGLLSNYSEKLNSLSGDKKRAVDNFIAKNPNQNDIFKFVDHLSNNDVDPNKINMDNMDLAKQKNNYGLLSMGRKDAEAWRSQPEQSVNAGLTGMPRMEQPSLSTNPINPQPEVDEDDSAGLLAGMNEMEKTLGLIH